MPKRCGKDTMLLSPGFSIYFCHQIWDKWCLPTVTGNQQEAAFTELFQAFKDAVADMESWEIFLIQRNGSVDELIDRCGLFSFFTSRFVEWNSCCLHSQGRGFKGGLFQSASCQVSLPGHPAAAGAALSACLELITCCTEMGKEPQGSTGQQGRICFKKCISDLCKQACERQRWERFGWVKTPTP